MALAYQARMYPQNEWLGVVWNPILVRHCSQGVVCVVWTSILVIQYAQGVGC